MERTVTPMPINFKNISWIYPSVEVIFFNKVQHRLFEPTYEIHVEIKKSINFEAEYADPNFVIFSFTDTEFQSIENHLIKKLVVFFEKERLDYKK